MAVTPFRIEVPDAVLDDLRERLQRTRWPDQIPGSAWDYGTDRDYLRELVSYWIDGFDWRAQEAKLNQLPQYLAEVDGVRIHFVHARGNGPRPMPLLLTHGWPGSFYEMHKVIGPLSDPAAHGANPDDAFDVVVPSLPGYGFSGPTTERGFGPARMAQLLLRLMTGELGYARFAAQGGDWGSIITTTMARLFPESLAGIHLNMLSGRLAPADPESEEEKLLAERAARFAQEETGYQRIQGTKPQTLAYALNDSPAGLAAWIVEKWRAWSDCGGDVERRFTKDEILTNITIYWVTGTINSSMRLYYEAAHAASGAGPAVPTGRVEVPTAVADFPAEIYRASRRQAEAAFNLQRWTPMPRGGHFAAMEEPGLLVEDIREFFRPLRR
ncbi:MAG TPA: epoxide hydrolase [Dehalococcoidia bacterium]|nr:epoxide hydrolase [Dehalococcoidia bacterium]